MKLPSNPFFLAWGGAYPQLMSAEQHSLNVYGVTFLLVYCSLLTLLIYPEVVRLHLMLSFGTISFIATFGRIPEESVTSTLREERVVNSFYLINFSMYLLNIQLFYRLYSSDFTCF